MAKKIIMPKFEMAQELGTVSNWLKQDGDTVKKGEPILEVETDKITMEVEATANGILAGISVGPGEAVPIGETIAYILKPGESLPTEAATPPSSPAETVSPIAQANGQTEPKATPVAERMAQSHGVDLQTVAAAGVQGRITKEDVQGYLTTQATLPLPGKVRAVPAARRLARELGVDLEQVTGSGPHGRIQSEDVRSMAVQQTASPRSVATLETVRQSAPTTLTSALETTVHFYSDGHRLEGTLFRPPGLLRNEPRVGVVLCSGYTYIRALAMPEIARRLNSAGHIALNFDYRGFGDSQGPPRRLLPHEQVRDIRAALTYLADQPNVAPTRLVLLGISLGGSNAIVAGAMDRRAQAVIAIEPMGNGERWLRGLRHQADWLDFKDRLVSNRLAMTRTGQSEWVDPAEIVIPDTNSRQFMAAVHKQYPSMQGQLPLDSAEAMLEYHPESYVAHIAPRPLLLIHGQADRLVSVDESHELYARASEPKSLITVPDMGHFNWVSPHQNGFQVVTDHVIQFLATMLNE